MASISYKPIVDFELLGRTISPHGIGIALGFLLGSLFLTRRSSRIGVSEEVVQRLLMRGLIGAVIGSRLAYVANHFSDYSDSPIDMIKAWEGGLSMLGGFAGGILAAVPLMIKQRINFWKLMDLAAPGFAVGVIVGRVGDLIVGDHLGTATNFFLGYKCTPGVRTASPCLAPVVHQTALYDLVMTIGTLAILLWLGKKRRFDGFLIMTFGALYGVQRMIEDFLREDVRRLGLTGSQWTALVFGLLCLYGVAVLRRTPKWGNWSRDHDPSAGLASELDSGETLDPVLESIDSGSVEEEQID